MRHIKVINEATELVPMLRALDTPIKREVFEEIIQDWKTVSEIEDKYGTEGADALLFFEKTKLVDIQWQINEENQREKCEKLDKASREWTANDPLSGSSSQAPWQA